MWYHPERRSFLALPLGYIHLVEAVSNRFKGNAIPRSIAFLRSFTMIPSIHKELGKLF
jgi:hypothetical protein